MRQKFVMLAAVSLILFAATPARADAVQDWVSIMLTTIGGQSPFAQARFAAITELAVFEAVNACTKEYEPYLGTIAAPRRASAVAAAIAAAHRVLRNYFPASAADLDARRAIALSTVPDGARKNDGIAVGEAAAAAMIAARANDGSSPLQTFLPDSTEPGVWQPTPPLFGPGILLNWRNVTPFGIRSTNQFRSAPPPALTSQRYRRDFDEIKAVGEMNSTHRPQDRTDVALLYAALSPAQVWNTAALQVSAAQRKTLSENARAFALLNMAITDALFSVFETKYFYTFWRPVTAIRAADVDGNPHTEADPGWTPFIVTPSFPSYGSAHGAGSNAARRIAEQLFGPDGHHIVISSQTPNVTLHYRNFRDMTDDIDDARVYGGIHFRFDQQAGGRQGRRIGRYIYAHNLRPLHKKEHDWHQ
jgi:hypothetical protein